MKKFLCALLAVLMVVSMFAGCGNQTPAEPSAPETPAAPEAPAEPETPAEPEAPADAPEYTGPEMELVFNFNASEEQSPQYLAALERITERTDGKVTFVNYFSSSLMTANDSMDGLGAGMADFSDVTLSNFKDAFPYTQQVVSYPFLGFTSLPMAADVMNDVILNNQTMLDEFHAVNIHPIFIVGVWGTAMAFAEDVEISTPDTVAGMKLACDNPQLMQFLGSVGATPVFQIPPDYYSCITNGVVDGLINGLNVIGIFGALQPAKSVYMFENGASTGVKAICINYDTWQSMDPTLQNIIMEELNYSEEYWEMSYEWWTTSDQSWIDMVNASGNPIRYIEGEAMQAWRDGVKPFGDAMLQELYDKGYTEVFDILQIWQDAIANYDGKY